MAVRMPLDAFGADEGNEGNEQGVKFHELWQHRAALHDLCQRIVGDSATADDVVQETYLRALRNLDQLERRPSLMPWLATVARRRSIDELRRRRYQTPVDVAPDESTKPEWDPGESVGVSETVERVREALTTLTPRERELLMRQVNHGLSLSELASEDDSSVASVRSVLSRARTKLRAALTDAGMHVLAPIFLLGGWMKRKLGPAASRAHQAAAMPVGYERFAETLVAGVAAAGLTFGGLPALAGLGTDEQPTTSPHVTTAAQSSDAPLASGVLVELGFEGEAAEGSETASDSGQTTSSLTDGHSDNGSGTTGVLPPGGGIAPTPPDDVTDPATRDRSTPQPSPRNPLEEPAAAVPEDTAVENFAAGAPQSNGSSTLFALGRTCADDTCSVLWTSTDGGASWTRLKADGLRAHTIMVPPGYPHDAELYAIGTAGLQVSTDRGKHFQTVLGPSYSGSAAMSPGFSDDDGGRHIYLGAKPNWRFDAVTEIASPLAMGLSGKEAHFAFDPGFATSKRMYAGTVTLDTSTPAVFVCDDGWCSNDDVVEFPELLAAPKVAVSSGDRSVVLAWQGSSLYRSVDAGETFTAVDVPLAGKVTGFSDDGASTLFLSVSDVATRTGGVLRSIDGGETWDVLGEGTNLSQGARSVFSSPDGRLLAAPDTEAGGGLLCSVDGGASWARRC